jgi:hypothetical protein
MAVMNLEASLREKRLLYQYVSSYAFILSYRPLKALRTRRHRHAITDSIVAKSKQSNSRIFVLILFYFQRILSSKYSFLDNWATIKRSFGLVSPCPNLFEARHRAQQP